MLWNFENRILLDNEFRKKNCFKQKINKKNLNFLK